MALAAGALTLCAAILPALRAHDVITTKITYSREISRLIYSRCASCHREGGSSFSLTTYEAARPWAKAIKEEVNERRMPPWGAVKGFGDFRDDQGLTQEQIELVNGWVEGGAPEGDPARLPQLPDFNVRPEVPKVATEVVVDGKLTLKSDAVIAGIRPAAVPENAPVKVLAERPDGGIEPMLWLYQYKAKFEHPFFFREPLRLAAGTQIEVIPHSASVTLLTQPVSRALSAGRHSK